MSDAQDLIMLRRQAERARLESPWLAEKFDRQADILQEEMESGEALLGDLLEMSTDKVKASQIAALLGAQYPELNQRIGRLASALRAMGFITEGQFAQAMKRLQSPAPTLVKMVKAQEIANKQYDETQVAILTGVGLENKQEALQLYNMVDGAKSDEKLREWVRLLIKAKLLPASYSATLRYSDGVNKIKQLISNLENK